MKTTKKVYYDEIRRISRIILRSEKSTREEYYKLYSKNLEGRYYIHSKAKKEQLENLYEDLINYASDSRINID